MRLPVLITLLCMTLAASARAQTVPIIALDYAGSNPGPLSFNPTAVGSPYPFRALPTLNTPASPCPNTDNTQPSDGGYTRCFKNFFQYFNPLTPSSGGYDLNVTNCRTTPINLQMRFGVTQNTALAVPGTGMPTSRIEWSVDGGAYTSVPTVLTNPLTGGYKTIKTIPGNTCTTPFRVQVRFRLRLEGDESATGANYTSAVDFRFP